MQIMQIYSFSFHLALLVDDFNIYENFSWSFFIFSRNGQKLILDKLDTGNALAIIDLRISELKPFKMSITNYICNPLLDPADLCFVVRVYRTLVCSLTAAASELRAQTSHFARRKPPFLLKQNSKENQS